MSRPSRFEFRKIAGAQKAPATDEHSSYDVVQEIEHGRINDAAAAAIFEHDFCLALNMMGGKSFEEADRTAAEWVEDAREADSTQPSRVRRIRKATTQRNGEVMESFFVEANYYVVARAKGNILAPKTPLVVEIKTSELTLDVPLAGFQMAFFPQVDARIRMAAQADFIKQLRSNSDLKRKIGGIQWAVVPSDETLNFPIFLKREQVGQVEKLIDTRNPYKIMDQINERNMTLANQIRSQVLYGFVSEGEGTSHAAASS